MKTYLSNQLRYGIKIIFNKKPYSIEKNEFVKPGKGQVFYRIKMRNLITFKSIEKTFRTTDFFKEANIINIKLKYLYSINEIYYFINQDNCEQISADKKYIGNNLIWLFSNENYKVTLWNNNPISVIPNKFIKIKVKDTTPNVKSDTKSSFNKIAVLSNNFHIKVPSFIQIGDLIKVNTITKEYISRVK
ncbi:elongation factor P [Buchnera aphidicola (Taiwanaphis decaspermi)]|uniref:elongation factor P n=1 Tax=Buchnera aphidicola TaxID=9 RepID=UPI0031B86955